MPDSAGVPIQVIINQDGSVTNTSSGGGQGEGTLADWLDDFTLPGASLSNYRDLGAASFVAQGAQIKGDGSGLAGAAGAGDWFFSPKSFDDINGNCRVYESIQMIQVGTVASKVCNVIGVYLARRSATYFRRAYINYTGAPLGTISTINLEACYSNHNSNIGTLQFQGSSEAGLNTQTNWWFIVILRAGVYKAYCVKNSGTSSEGIGGDPLGIGTNDFDNTYPGPDLAANWVGTTTGTPAQGGSGTSNTEGAANAWANDYSSWMPGRVGLWVQGLGPNDRILKYRCIPLSYRNPPV